MVTRPAPRPAPRPVAPPPTTDELKQEVEKVLEAVEASASDDAPDPRDEPEWVFPFSFRDARGKTWEGNFKNKILTVAEQQAVSVLQAKFQGGLPVESFEPGILEVNRAIAHMTYSLVDRPAWAKELRSILDMSLVLKIWEEVASHEARFFRLDANPA